MEVESNELWDSSSELYNSISLFISSKFDVTITPGLIYGGYILVNDEPDDYSSIFEIIDSTSGVFKNDNKEHNGKVFLRYYFEEDEEIYDEKVCLVIP